MTDKTDKSPKAHTAQESKISRARVIRYGDNVDTDVIIPARYLNTANAQELACHCMEDLDPGFVHRVQPGDILVAGKNFGCGSSREHAPLAIKESGIVLVVAESFARIFYRNAINIGLAIIESPEAVRDTEDGDEISANLGTGVLINHTRDRQYAIKPFSPFIQSIIVAGGLTSLATSGGL
jgi:3-isopropylmalate/(R)-2-methylmalate dehydratase small subunit